MLEFELEEEADWLLEILEFELEEEADWLFDVLEFERLETLEPVVGGGGTGFVGGATLPVLELMVGGGGG